MSAFLLVEPPSDVRARALMRARKRMVGLLLAGLTLAMQPLSAQSTAGKSESVPSLPPWAQSAFTTMAGERGLVRSSAVKPALLSGDYDGDGTADVAVLVEKRSTHKVGIVIVHGGSRPRPQLFGAGVEFGNGGDDFAWMDHWAVAPRKGLKSVALLVEKQESGGGLIQFVNGRYRWRQNGD